MPVPVDYQRSRVYRAENALPPEESLGSVAACAAFAKEVLATKTVAFYGFDRSEITFWEVYQGPLERRRKLVAQAYVKDRAIALPAWAWTPRNVLHELTHVFLGPEYLGHHASFCRIYLELTWESCGEEASLALENAFATCKVKVSGDLPAWYFQDKLHHLDRPILRLIGNRWISG